jgi:hypothetical protein
MLVIPDDMHYHNYFVERISHMDISEDFYLTSSPREVESHCIDVSFSPDKLNDLACSMMSSAELVTADVISDALNIIYDITELSRDGFLVTSRCAANGVFERLNYYGLRYFDALAAAFIAEAIGRADLNATLLSYTRTYGITFPNEFEVSNLFYQSCDALTEYSIFQHSVVTHPRTSSTDIDCTDISASSNISPPIPSSLSVATDDGVSAYVGPSVQRRHRRRSVDAVLEAAGVRVAPKGVYTTGSGSFRVQLNIKSTGSKFSRNVETLLDALWLYEIKVLTADKPKNVSVMINLGNFKTLSDLAIVTSVSEYFAELKQQVMRLYEIRVLHDEIEVADAFEAYYQMNGFGFFSDAY